MSDVFDVAKRSEVMSRIRGRGNKSTELVLAKALRLTAVKGWRRHLPLRIRLRPRGASGKDKSRVFVVRPDFTFKQERMVVFVDGCFWHQCPLHSKVPASNRGFWEPKLRANVVRDRTTDRVLKAAGWRVLRIWEHELGEPLRAATKIKRALSRVVEA